MENTDKNRKKRWLLLLFLLLLLLLLGVLFCRKKPQTNTAPAPESSISTPAGGGTVSLTYSDAAGIDLTAGQVTLLFANPEKSGWDATVCLVVGEREAARSDLLAPGEQVTQLALLEGAEKDLSCSGTLKVSFYHPQTGAKAMLDAEIPVTVTVTGCPPHGRHRAMPVQFFRKDEKQ